MNRALVVTLGIVTALGGFVDVGEIVFASQAGARFGYGLLWPVIVGAAAIAVYSEMCGRVAIVTRKPVFVLVRERLGFSVGLCTLVSSVAVTVLTCAAEVGGVAIVLRLLTNLPYGLWIAVGLLLLVTAVSLLPFERLERVFGLIGLFMLVFVAAAFALGVDWGQAARGLVPHLEGGGEGQGVSSYAYFAVGLIAATVMPYEVQFYSSGQIEEGHGPEDLPVNTLTAFVGIGFGAVVVLALIVAGAQVLQPRSIDPDQLGSAMISAFEAFAVPGLLAGLLGALFAIGGAAVETSLSGAYAIAQFFGFEWGKQGPRAWQVPRFTLSWLSIFGLALLLLATNVDPIQITEYAVVFSVVVLPLTYAPILLVARDREVMGAQANNALQNVLAIVFLCIIVLVAIAAVPLMYLSRMGQA
jgi:manganese transport protein